MLRRGAHSIVEARREPRRLRSIRRALSCGSARARTAVSVAAIVLCVAGAGVLDAHARRSSIDQSRLIAARLGVAQIGNPGWPPSKLAPGKAAKVRNVAASPVVRSPVSPSVTATVSPPVTPTVTPTVAAPVAPTAAPVPPPDPIRAYRGLGAWMDWWDYGHPGDMDPAAIVDRLAQRGVRTLYLQTGLWSQSPDMLNPGVINTFLDRAHARGIQVVGWYLPGFADIDHDLRASLAVLAYTSPSGQHVDGFAPDIEDRSAIEQAARRTVTVPVARYPGCARNCTKTMVVDGSSVDVLARFNAAISDYSSKLRQSVPAGTALGAIVPDAKNDERAPDYWAGFPWAALASRYDVLLPMAYWSVTKPAACPAADAGTYIRDVVATTEALLGSPKPIHPIGGVADCLKAQDVTTYVDAAKAAGSIGGSLYDFLTIEVSPDKEAFWSALKRLNSERPLDSLSTNRCCRTVYTQTRFRSTVSGPGPPGRDGQAGRRPRRWGRAEGPGCAGPGGSR